MIPETNPLQAHFSLDSRPPFRLMSHWTTLALDIPHVYRYMSHHRVVLHRHPDPRQLKEREPALDGEVIQWARDYVATLLPRGLG